MQHYSQLQDDDESTMGQTLDGQGAGSRTIGIFCC